MINQFASRNIRIPIVASRCISLCISRIAYRVSHIACIISESVIGCPTKKLHANVWKQLLRIMQICAGPPHATATPCKVFCTYLACSNVTENKNETCLRPFLINLIFLSEYKRERENELIWVAYMAAATTTRHNSKTTIIKANSKEVVRKKRVVHG